MAKLFINKDIVSDDDKMKHWYLTGADGMSFSDVQQFISWMASDDNSIDIEFHSCGGDVDEGYAIYDAIRATGKEISATVVGRCGSMATVILLAAPLERRKMYQHAKICIHDPYCPGIDGALDIETLESIKEASVDPADNGKKFINPLYLSEDSLGKVYDIVPLNGKHNNVAFALRNTEDAEGSFVIESNDLYNDPETGLPQSKYSKIGSFAGAWIKIHNNVPVLAKFYDKNGDHNTGDTTDSWLNMGDWAPVANGDEVINQAARFTFSAIEKDSQATANEEIAASSVIVAGTNGAVVVKGAEGKNVIVSTILGKVVANEVLTSDNAQIAAPQGVVVVSVDGESFKVVVK